MNRVTEKTEVHNPPNKKLMNEVYLIVSVDERGMEGIVAQKIGNEWLPGVTGERELAENIFALHRSNALKLGVSNKSIRLVRFSQREVLK